MTLAAAVALAAAALVIGLGAALGRAPADAGAMAAAAAILACAAAVLLALYLRGSGPRRSAARQAELEGAVAQVDRELAADLELTGMFDQTKQAFVLENGVYLAVRAVLERELPAVFSLVKDVYDRIPAAEASMERRGPAGSIPEADRARVEEWEGDAREAQRVLRAAARPARVSRWRLIVDRLGGRPPAAG